MCVRVVGWQGEAVAGIDCGRLRESAVDLIPGEAGLVAEILPPCSTVEAGAARGPEPGHADAVPQADSGHSSPHGLHRTNDFVARDDRNLGLGELPVHEVQVRATDPAGPHTEA